MSEKLLMLATMIKNEEQRAVKTIRSAEPFVDMILVLDTGSTDNTVSMVMETLQQMNKPYCVKHTIFKNYRDTMNELLNICNTEFNEYTFIMPLDANAEVRNGEIIRPYLRKCKENRDLMTIHSTFEFDNDMLVGVKKLFSYILAVRNTELIRWKGPPIHCYIGTANSEDVGRYTFDYSLKVSNLTIYQDRMKDKPNNDRWDRDIDMLLKYIQEQKQNEKSSVYNTVRAYRYLLTTFMNKMDYKTLLRWANIFFEEHKQFIETHKEYNDDYYVIMKYTSCAMFHTTNDIDINDSTQMCLKSYNYIKSRNVDYCEPLYNLFIFLLRNKMTEEAYKYLKLCCCCPDLRDRTINIGELQISEGIFTERWKNLLRLAFELNKITDYDWIIKSAKKAGVMTF